MGKTREVGWSMGRNSLARLARAFALGVACALPLVHAGQVDAGHYVLTYDDALGTPSVVSAGGMVTYAFPSFTMLASNLPDSYALPQSRTFGARVVAAPGWALRVRSDATFPVKAEVALSDFAAWPDETPQSTGYYDVGSPSEGYIHGAATVDAGAATLDVGVTRTFDIRQPGTASVRNIARPGSSANAAVVSLSAVIHAQPATYNIWYCPGCQYLGPGDPTPPLELLGQVYSDIYVEGRFSPLIVVDERFITAVPAPTSTSLMVLGLVGVLIWRRAANPR